MGLLAHKTTRNVARKPCKKSLKINTRQTSDLQASKVSCVCEGSIAFYYKTTENTVNGWKMYYTFVIKLFYLIKCMR